MSEAHGTQGSAAAPQPPPLRITRILHARPETVFKAWSSSEHVKNWFSPETYSVSDADVQMHIGGPFHVCMRAPSGEEHWTRGTFVEIAPNKRLVIEMRTTDTAGAPLFDCRTEVDIAETLGGTKMDILQTYVFIDPAVAAPMVGGAQEGWRTTLVKLEAEAIRMQGGSETNVRNVVHATFHLERALDAPVARVWKALTDAQQAKQKWFGGPPGGWELIERRMDVRVGGTERLAGRWEGGVVSTFDATYLDVVPLERLIYSCAMHMGDKQISVSLATMQLKAEGAKTRLMVTEQGAFLDGYDDAGSREEGTAHLLEALAASLAD